MLDLSLSLFSAMKVPIISWSISLYGTLTVNKHIRVGMQRLVHPGQICPCLQGKMGVYLGAHCLVDC